MIRFACLVAVASSCFLATAHASTDPGQVKVMIVGVFHMSNPGRDQHNVHVEDVLQPGPQAQIAAVVKGLAKFKPNLVAAEWPADILAERYAKYAAGTLAASRNEVVQLGFATAKASGARMVGVDVDGEFPYDAVDAYAKAHGQSDLLDAAGAEIEAMVKTQERMLATRGIGATLRYLNDPKLIADSNGFYRTTLKIGGGAQQPGADLLTAWYRRNFLICANIVQMAKPGDRIVVFYGSGHSILLRQCIQETPGFELVEANAYLPK
jgi:hypothetical protein